jgi:tetratricopeptide (TPR) repeat protein
MTTQDEKIESLIDEAFDAIEDYDIARALNIGRKLKKMRHASGFEILSLAYDADEKKDEAIDVLEEGVAAFPTAWNLWQLLGNLYSDEDRYQDSQRCYQKALQCPDVDTDLIFINSSIAYSNNKEYMKALELVEQVTSEEHQPRAMSHRITLLNLLGRHEEAVLFGEKALESTVWDEETISDLATIHGELASAIWKFYRNRDRALHHAWLAIELDKSESAAAWVIRDIAAETSPKARHMTVIIRGQWHEPLGEENEPPGFFANYEVVAETPEEALTFILPFEPQKVRGSLGIEECALREPAPGIPKGVYEAQGSYMMFPWDEEA